MKRIVSLVLALSMVLGLFVTSFAAAELSDVVDTKYEAAVEALMELEVVTGYPNGTYKPEKEVNRAELAKMLVICMGLEEDAERAQGDNIFTDESLKDGEAYAWARGYVNTAAAAGIIKGYPTGDFKPEKTVTYAEALTMMLRALGYGNVMEEEGTWPTNAILKARELELTDDVEYNSSSDGATRGDIAILLWNMLRTNMWKITSENQGTGMTSEADKVMLNVKFPDYSYEEVTFESFEIDELDDEAAVLVTFEEGNTAYAYAKNDFYTFVPGTTVEVLINVEEDELLMMVPTDDDKLVAGKKDDIDDDYSELKAENYGYAYTRVVRRAVADATMLATSSIYVDEVEMKEKKDYIKINDKKYEDDDWDYEIVLRDGERVGLRDVEVGDILTTVIVLDLELGKEVERFYVLGGTEAEGEFTRYAEVEYENSELTFLQLTVGGKKYVVDAKATFVEDPEEEDVDAEDLATYYEDKMEGEDVVLKLDPFFGTVVRVEFDGKIDSGDDDVTTVKLFGVEEDVDRDGRTYSITFVNEDGSDEYEYTRNSDAAQNAQANWADAVEEVGTFVWVELDQDGKVVNQTLIANYDDKVVDDSDILYGEEAEDEYYTFVEITAADFDDDENEVSNEAGDKISVGEDTVVVTLVFDDKGTNKDYDDEYRIEFAQGLEAVEEIVSNEDVWAIYDLADKYQEAKYILVWNDASDKSNNRVGKVTSAADQPLVGGEQIELEDEDEDELTYKIADDTKDLSTYELLVYTITTTSKGKEVLNFVAGLNEEELNIENEHGYVEDAKTGRHVIITGQGEVKLDGETYTDLYEDYMVVLVTVDETDVDGQYEVDTFEVMDYASASLKEADRVSFDDEAEVVFVIRGMEKLED